MSCVQLCHVVQSCLSLCNHQAPQSMGILQARTLEWVAMFSFRGSSQSRDQKKKKNKQTQGSNPGLPHCRWILYCLSHQGSIFLMIINKQYHILKIKLCYSDTAYTFFLNTCILIFYKFLIIQKIQKQLSTFFIQHIYIYLFKNILTTVIISRKNKEYYTYQTKPVWNESCGTLIPSNF